MVRLSELLHASPFSPNFPRSPLLKVPRKCGRISLTTYLTTTAISSTEYPGLAKFGIAPGLGPGDRGFKSRSPDQSRQFSVRKLAVLTFWKGFSLFIAAQILTYHSAPKSDLQYEISWSVNSALYSDLHTECSIVKSNLPQSSNVVYPSDG